MDEKSKPTIGLTSRTVEKIFAKANELRRKRFEEFPQKNKRKVISSRFRLLIHR